MTVLRTVTPLIKFEIKKSPKTGQWYFRIVAKNGRKLAHSEQYRQRADAIYAIRLIQQHAFNSEVE